MKPTLETIKALLESANISQLSKDTGLHYNTLRYIRDGVIKNPGVNTIKRIMKSLCEY